MGNGQRIEFFEGSIPGTLPQEFLDYLKTHDQERQLLDNKVRGMYLEDILREVWTTIRLINTKHSIIKFSREKESSVKPVINVVHSQSPNPGPITDQVDYSIHLTQIKPEELEKFKKMFANLIKYFKDAYDVAGGIKVNMTDNDYKAISRFLFSLKFRLSVLDINPEYGLKVGVKYFNKKLSVNIIFGLISQYVNFPEQ